MKTKMKKLGTVRPQPEAVKPSAARPQQAAIETLDRSTGTTPNPDSKAIQASAGSEAKLSEAAVKLAVADLMKQTFGTKDEDLQYRFVMQAGTIFPDFAGRELKSFDLAAASLRGIGPRDSLEGMLGVQMVAVHTLAMELMRRAAWTGQTDLGIEVNVNRATKLLRTFTSLTEALSRYRGKVEQKMTVEHVHVYQGGQAIVGQATLTLCDIAVGIGMRKTFPVRCSGMLKFSSRSLL